MKTRFAVLLAAFSVAVSGSALLAHHSFTTEYDGNKTFNVKGTVSKVEWTNPHARFYVDTMEQGKAVTWNMELASPSALAPRMVAMRHTDQASSAAASSFRYFQKWIFVKSLNFGSANGAKSGCWKSISPSIA